MASSKPESKKQRVSGSKKTVRKPAKKKTEKQAASVSAPSCETSLVNLDNVRQVKPEVIETEQAQHMVAFFSALSDPHRLRILRSHRLVKYRRQGRNVYYSMADKHVETLYKDVAEHLDE